MEEEEEVEMGERLRTDCWTVDEIEQRDDEI